MSAETLFTGVPSKTEAHLPEAEMYVSPLSRYVLDELPADLEAIRSGVPYEALHVAHSVLLNKVKADIMANTDPRVAEITQLDLAFMLGSYLPAGDKAFELARMDSPSLQMPRSRHHRLWQLVLRRLAIVLRPDGDHR